MAVAAALWTENLMAQVVWFKLERGTATHCLLGLSARIGSHLHVFELSQLLNQPGLC